MASIVRRLPLAVSLGLPCICGCGGADPDLPTWVREVDSVTAQVVEGESLDLGTALRAGVGLDGGVRLDLVIGARDRPAGDSVEQSGGIFVVPAMWVGRVPLQDVAAGSVAWFTSEPAIDGHFDLGDMDGDGRLDLLVGVNRNCTDDTCERGYAYAGPLVGEVDPSTRVATLHDARDSGDAILARDGATAVVVLGNRRAGSLSFYGAASWDSSIATVSGLPATAEAAAFLESAGDCSGDAVPEVLVGAPGDEGAVYVVDGAIAGGATWTDASYLTVTGPGAGSGLGTFASIDPGSCELLVGAPGAGAVGSGSARLFRATAGLRAYDDADASFEWDHADENPLGERFGQSVGFAGDIDGDGTSEVWIAAPRAFDRAGAVAFFSDTSQGGSRSASLDALVVIAGPEPLAEFGSAVVALGDIDGDGFDDVAVGAPAAGAALPGRVYVIHGRASW